MNEQVFVERSYQEWQRLTELCDRAETSPSHLNSGELREFVRLYRRASRDLAVARTRSTNIPLIDYLNDLTGRTYAILYRQPRRPIRQALSEALALSAQTVRRRRWFVLTSFLVFFGSAILVFGLLQSQPSLRGQFVSPQMEGLFDGWKSGKFDERTGSQGAQMTALYASNNPRVSMVAGAVGAGTFGTLSLYMLAQNGEMIGVLANELAPLGRVDFLLSSVAPHGVPELSGIIISGSAGLLLGYALINPGRRTRADSLKAVGPDAMVLLTTSICLMFIAAPIEGFFSFNPRVPGWLKVTVAVVTLTGWLLFWSGFWRTEEERGLAKPE